MKNIQFEMHAALHILHSWLYRRDMSIEYVCYHLQLLINTLLFIFIIQGVDICKSVSQDKTKEDSI